MVSLPPEIVQEIIEISLLSSRSPLGLLTTCATFRDICQQHLYSRLDFTSRAQLSSFISMYGQAPVPYAPRMIGVRVTNDDSSNIVFSDIYALFSQCFLSSASGNKAERDGKGRIILDLLQLRLNSHMHDPRTERIYTALSQVNPRRFIWTGPDPPHHFSIAIVPEAVPHLFAAISTYTNLIELRLTNVNMIQVVEAIDFPVIPSLEVLNVGQIVFLPPAVIARLILNPEMKRLERVNLIDAYTESIWGPRLRRSDVVRAALAQMDPMDLEFAQKSVVAKDIIEKVLICEAKTERIMGGDRVEANSVLL